MRVEIPWVFICRVYYNLTFTRKRDICRYTSYHESQDGQYPGWCLGSRRKIYIFIIYEDPGTIHFSALLCAYHSLRVAVSSPTWCDCNTSETDFLHLLGSAPPHVEYLAATNLIKAPRCRLYSTPSPLLSITHASILRLRT